MSWKNKIYGSENPEAGHVKVLNITYLLLILFFYGLWEDFSPSNGTIDIGFKASLLISGFLFILLLLYGIKRWRKKNSSANKLMINGKSIALLLFIPFLIEMLVWFASVYSVPALYTRISGDHHIDTVAMSKSHDRGYRGYGCDYKLTDELLFSGPFEYLCISSETYHRLPEGLIEIHIEGKQSRLGILVTKYGIPL